MPFRYRAGRFALLALLLIAPTARGFDDGSSESPEESTADLSSDHQVWLDEVDALLSHLERETFLGLGREYQREAFIARFWTVRDPYPGTSRNELEEQWRDNAELARDFEPADARSTVVRLFGEPAGRLEGRCAGVLDPVEVWSYAGNYLVGSGFSLAFVQTAGDRDGVYDHWDPGRGLGSLFVFSAPNEPQAAIAAIAENCLRGGDLVQALVAVSRWSELEEQLRPVLHPNPEWVLAFQARSTALPEGARTLPVKLSVDFTGRHQSRTVVQGLLSVPRESAAAAPTGEGEGFAFLVDGEVLRRGELFDHFRYRFDLPADALSGPDIPVLVERYLRPGRYDLILKLEDLNGEAFYREERRLEVPVFRRRAAVVHGSAPPDPLESAPDEPIEDVVVEIAPVPAELITGLVRIHAEVRGPDVARVRFELDDRTVLSKRNPPYDVELNLGRAPRVHTVRALALDADGEILGSDETALNAGPHRFAVRLVEPRANRPPGTPLRARAVVDLPEGERLDRLELFVDDTLLATLYQPPYAQPLIQPENRKVSYVRAVAHLAEGGTAEDVAFLHAPGEIDEMDVQLVELYTSVTNRRGRPVSDLTREAFEVREEGKKQEILRFEWVEDLPVHGGILLDTSTSMLPVIEDAKQAALGFFEKLLTPRDRAAVITFNDQPKLEVRFTNKIPRLAGGLSNVVVEGETALYDSLIYALYYFGGVQGKRLLVVISDGEDSTSRYSFEEALEFARRAGVSIYAIGLNLPSDNELARMALQRLSTETGGRFYFIESARELQAIYDRIEKELRSQYLLAYQSNRGDLDPEHYREIEVEVTEPGLTARTLKGYYP